MSTWKPENFITGGQTGGDSIPLRIHDVTGCLLKGNMPKGYKRDDGNGEKTANKYGLGLSEGGFGTKDRENAGISDAIVGFLTTKPMTGKGTMQTVNMFVEDGSEESYKFVILTKPENRNFLVMPPMNENSRPALIFWDVGAENVEEFSQVLSQFLNTYQPINLMVSGSTEKIWPGTETFGTSVFLKAFGI